MRRVAPAGTDEVQHRVGLVLLISIVLVGTCWVLGFPRSDEDWVDLIRLRRGSPLDALLPFEDYQYYRPAWHFYLKLCDMAGLSGGPAHLGIVAAHLGGLVLVHGLLRRLGCRPLHALVPTVLAGIAPGTSGALSWLAAGNKAFTFLFLALGASLVQRARSPAGLIGAMVVAAVPALGSSESAYVLVLLFPLVALFRTPFREGAPRIRWRDPLLLLAACMVLGLLHLSLAAPTTDPIESRPRQLLIAFQAGWGRYTWEVAQNLGRYFIHGIGLGDDCPVLGSAVLCLLCGLGIFFWRGRRSLRNPYLLLSVLVFVLLNMPASLFPGESSRHHAYLPAIGAGLVCGCLMIRLLGGWHRGLRVVSAVSVLWFLLQGWAGQRLWARYLRHTRTVLESSGEALPEPPHSARVILLNVPEEYRTVFNLRFGEQARAETWPNFCILGNRKEILLPKGADLPGDEGVVLIEYDGQGLRRSSFAEVLRRERAPSAWFLDEITGFPDPVLPWGAIQAGDQALRSMNWGFKPERTDIAESDPGRHVEVLAQGRPQPSSSCAYEWEVKGETASPAWLVLGWSPLFFPIIQRPALFLLHPLPWAFRVEVEDLGSPRHTASRVVRPVLGFLPALRLEPGPFHLKTRLFLRL